MKRILFALAVLGTAMLSSCVREKSFESIPLGENDIAFVMSNSATRSADVSYDVVKGVSIMMGTTPDGEPLVFEETIEELNPGPVTRGIPIYTANVGKVYDAMNVYGTYQSGSSYVTGGFGVNGATFEAFDMYPHPGSDPQEDGWRYRGNYSSSPWPDKTTPVDFYLRMPESGTGETDFQRLTSEKKVSFTLASPAKAEDQQDLLFGFTSISKNTHDSYLPAGAPVTMYHALSGVKFANGHENNNQTKTIISRVEFTGLVDNGSCVMDPYTGAVTWTPGSPRTVTQGEESFAFTFYQDFANPTYAPQAGLNNSDGTVDFTDPDTNPDLYGTSWTAAAGDHNLNDADGSLTFWFIPQQINENVKLTVYFQIKTPDTPNGIDLKPVTIDFGKLVNGVGTDSAKQVEWKAGQLRTYTLKPYEVDVDIIDSMSTDGKEKSEVRISNPGNVDEYVRVLIMGNWYGWKTEASKNAGDPPSILVGYQYKDKDDPNLPNGLSDAQREEYLKKMVLPWYREGYPLYNGVYYESPAEATAAGWDEDTGEYGDPYGHFDDSFKLADLGSAVETDGKPRDGHPNGWADASGGFYYTAKIGPGDLIAATQSATNDLFKSYTLDRTPTIYLPVGSSRQAAYGVHLVMEIVVQAIQVPKKKVMVDGKEVEKDIWWLEAWYEATGVAKLHPNAKKGTAYRNAIYRDYFMKGINGGYGDVVYDKYPVPEQ